VSPALTPVAACVCRRSCSRTSARPARSRMRSQGLCRPTKWDPARCPAHTYGLPWMRGAARRRATARAGEGDALGAGLGLCQDEFRPVQVYPGPGEGEDLVASRAREREESDREDRRWVLRSILFGRAQGIPESGEFCRAEVALLGVLCVPLDVPVGVGVAGGVGADGEPPDAEPFDLAVLKSFAHRALHTGRFPAARSLPRTLAPSVDSIHSINL
jgi:hypothetical protein